MGLTSKIWAKCVSLLVNMALMQWMAYLAWRGGPRFALACSTGSKTLGGASRRAPLQTTGSSVISHEECSMWITTVFICIMQQCDCKHPAVSWKTWKDSIKRWNVRFDVRKTLFHLASCVFEDLQRSLCNLFVIHLQTAQQGLKRLCGVERHRVCEGEHLCGRTNKRSNSWMFTFNNTQGNHQKKVLDISNLKGIC